MTPALTTVDPDVTVPADEEQPACEICFTAEDLHEVAISEFLCPDCLSTANDRTECGGFR